MKTISNLDVNVLFARFWPHVDQRLPNECWPWRGRTLKKMPYGKFDINGNQYFAHRVAYELGKGPISDDKPYVLHTCDNPRCCNPAHLVTGTLIDNNRDRDVKGRHRAVKGKMHYLRRNPERILRGEQTGRAKLTDGIVQIILASPQPIRALAREFEISQRLVQKIKRGEAWTHITRPQKGTK